METPSTPDAHLRREIAERAARILADPAHADLIPEGDAIEVIGLDEDRVLQVRLHGGCAACHSSIYALTIAVERILKEELPEVRFVEAVP